MAAIERKRSLRRKFLNARAGLSPDARAEGSRAAVRRLVESGRLDGAKVVAIYAALEGEIDPIDVEAVVERVAYPRVDGRDLRFFVSRHKDLVPRTMKIPEPLEGEQIALDDIDVFVVPGLAFTPDGRRLGFGGGYYDRTLAGRNTRAFGIAFDEQIADDLPFEDYDVRVAAVFTPTRTFDGEDLP
ncbi:MAG: 5-formyltetrahydrofolate cyclo-ligase [Deltaproteobacteria bacterium]